MQHAELKCAFRVDDFSMNLPDNSKTENAHSTIVICYESLDWLTMSNPIVS